MIELALAGLVVSTLSAVVGIALSAYNLGESDAKFGLSPTPEDSTRGFAWAYNMGYRKGTDNKRSKT